jgi:DNA-binding NtrC family response regulator
MSSAARSRMALVVHPDLGVLNKYQTIFKANQYTTVVARDLPTALLAITQHYFDVAIVASHLGESGDGWPLAGVLHLVFPNSFIGVLVPGADLVTLQTAINNGVQDVFENDRPPEAIVAAILGSKEPSSAKTTKSRPAVH